MIPVHVLIVTLCLIIQPVWLASLDSTITFSVVSADAVVQIATYNHNADAANLIIATMLY